MDSPSFKAPGSPQKGPLFPVSPERINQQKLASSPSMPSDLRFPRKNSTASSEVQAKVAMINGLSRTSSPTPATHSSSTSSAALQRAILGREEAESALANVTSQLSEAQTRERRISERLESLLEELQAAKERQAHERAVFEKEVRRARKEAFKAGSMLVKLQEEIKISRTEIKGLKDELKAEKETKDKAKQEAFERAYALAGLTEELEVLKGKLRSLETESHSDALEARAKEMREDNTERTPLAERHRTSPTPTPRRLKRGADDSDKTQLPGSGNCPGQDQSETPPKKPRLSRHASPKENQDPAAHNSEENLIEELKFEVHWERRLRQDAEDMIHFLKMECQFKQCSCRIAERQGIDYVHDEEWHSMHKKEETQVQIKTEETDIPPENNAPIPSHHPSGSPARASTPVQEVSYATAKQNETLDEPTITFSPTTGTFRALPSPVHDAPQHVEDGPPVLPERSVPQPQSPLRHVLPSSPPAFVPQTETDHGYSQHTSQVDVAGPNPALPSTAPVQVPPSLYDNLFDTHRHEPSPEPRIEETTIVKENVTVLKVPLLPENHTPGNTFATIPGTPISREEALAQIRARRGRARSVTKRSASACEGLVRSGGMGMTPVRGARRIPGLHNADSKSESDLGERRDLSAPVGKY